MQKCSSCQTGKQIGAWLLRFWDGGANSRELEGEETQLESFIRDQGIDREVTEEYQHNKQVDQVQKLK